MAKIYRFPLDHFGIVASPLIQQLVAQTGDKRKRKSAMRALHQMAKSTKQIGTYDRTIGAGLTVDVAGQIWLFLETELAVVATPDFPPKHAGSTPSTKDNKGQENLDELEVVRGTCGYCSKKIHQVRIVELPGGPSGLVWYHTDTNDVYCGEPGKWWDTRAEPSATTSRKEGSCGEGGSNGR